MNYSNSDNNVSSVLISVIVPIYNVDQYLEQCLSSLAMQSLKDIEVLLIDDGSTDNSRYIAEKFSKNDPRFVFIHRSNHGYGAEINYGLNRAKGRYIGIVEPDDFIDPKMYEKLYACAADEDVDIVRCNYYEFSNSSIKSVKNIDREMGKEGILRSAPAIWAGIYNRAFLNVNGIRMQETPGASYQDTSFHFLTTTCAKNIRIEESCLLYYRVNNPKQSTATKNMARKAGLLVSELEYISNFFDNSPPNVKAYLRYLNSRLRWICESLPPDEKVVIAHKFGYLVRKLKLRLSDKWALLMSCKLRKYLLPFISVDWFSRSIIKK